jgi:parallel beta-helix repeat protein
MHNTDEPTNMKADIKLTKSIGVNNSILFFATMLLFLVFFVILFSKNATAATITVAKSGGDYFAIQTAIDAASNGDTIYVKNGTYYEHITISKTINLTGEDQNTTIIDGSGTGTIITIDYNDVKISNFTIRNGAQAISRTLGMHNNIRIMSNIIKNINTTTSYCVFLTGSNNNISSNTITNITTASSSLYCVYIEGGSNNNISSNTITNITTTSSNVYGIVLASNGNNITQNILSDIHGASSYGVVAASYTNITSNTITNITTTAGTNSYGIFLSGSNNNITLNTITKNVYGVRLDGGPTNIITNNDIYANREYGVYNTVSGNTAINNWWGDASGPKHAAQNPNGKGDNVSFSTYDIEITNWATAPFNDNLPTPHLTAPAEGAVYNIGMPITFSGYTNDTEDGFLTDSSLCWSSNKSGSIGTGNFTTSNLTAGKHKITLTVTDSYGARSEATVNITVNSPPTAYITSPTNGQVITYSQSIQFTGYGSDNEDGFLAGSSISWSSNISGNLGNGNFTLNNLSIGKHLINLTVTDSNGSIAYKTVNITINTLPTAYITAPFEGAVFNYMDTINFTGYGNDSEDGFLIGSSTNWSSNITGYFGNGNTTSSGSTLSAGTHKITLTVKDSAGSTTNATINITIKLQPTAPTLTITFPPNGATVAGTVNITGTASDPNDNLELQNIQVKVDNGNWNIATGTTNWYYVLDTTALLNGAHTIYARAFDGGLYSTTISRSIDVDNTAVNNPPVVTITSPSAGGTVNGTIIISGTATDVDGNSQLQNVQVKIDAGVWNTATGTTLWAYSLDTTLYSNDSYTIYVRAFDGNTYSATVSRNIIISNIAPGNGSSTPLTPDITISEFIPSATTAIEGDIITINATIHMENGTRDNISVALFDNDVNASSYVVGISPSNTTMRMTWMAVNGTHILRLMVDTTNLINETNEANNNATATINVTPKQVPPAVPLVVTVTSPKDNSVVKFAKVRVEGTASSDVEIKRVEVSLDNNAWLTCEGTTNWSVEIPLSVGKNTVYIKALDKNNNVNTTSINITRGEDTGDGGKDGGFIPSTNAPAIIATVGALAVAAAFFRRRNNK